MKLKNKISIGEYAILVLILPTGITLAFCTIVAIVTLLLNFSLLFI